MYYPKEHNPITSTVIVEPVGGNCNLACVYCYHSNIRAEKLSVMPMAVLERLIREGVKINPDRIKYLWHGGEPMLAGIKFYQEVIRLQERLKVTPKQKISNHLQTNATLITDEWASFFKTCGFKVSTSIDGPEGLHNQCRFNVVRVGSFRQVVEGINTLQRFGLTVGVVTTISVYNAGFPEDVYKTLIGLGIKNFELNIASNVVGASSLAPSPKDAATFLKRVFDLWFKEDDPSIYIRIFHNTIRSLTGLPMKDCSFSYNHCREYVACDENGELYTCGRFLKEPEAHIGSLMSESLPVILENPTTNALYNRVAKIKDECHACKWLGACGGGCAYQRWLNGGFGSSFPQCEIRKELFEHIAQRVGKYLPTQVATLR